MKFIFSLSHILGFILYLFIAVGLAVYLIFWVAPIKGQTNILIYIAICSLIGSLSVVGCKGLSIAIKLTLSGHSQLQNPLAWFFVISVATCITIQMNYLNKSLDIFNTSLVTPIYYVMFTTLTITASAILFKEWAKLTASDIVGSLCGFSVIVCGVFLLHAFKDLNFTFKDLISLTGNSCGQESPTLGRVDPVTIVMEPLDQSRLSRDDQSWNESRTGNQSAGSGSEEEINLTERDKFIATDKRTLS